MNPEQVQGPESKENDWASGKSQIVKRWVRDSIFPNILAILPIIFLMLNQFICKTLVMTMGCGNTRLNIGSLQIQYIVGYMAECGEYIIATYPLAILHCI
jgi:hypothetical protein